MKRNKCKLCGKYENREKEIGIKKLNVSDDIEIPIFHYWKWCKVNGDWCRNIAGNCNAFIPEKKVEDSKICDNNCQTLINDEKYVLFYPKNQ